jgi:hypothetical protein
VADPCIQDKIRAPADDPLEGKNQGVVHPPDAQVADGVDPDAHDLRGEDDDQAVGQFFLQK